MGMPSPRKKASCREMAHPRERSKTHCLWHRKLTLLRAVFFGAGSPVSRQPPKVLAFHFRALMLLFVKRAVSFRPIVSELLQPPSSNAGPLTHLIRVPVTSRP